MTIQSHLDALLKKHEDLDKEIRRIETRAFVNDTNLHEMKKKRLRVKEEIERTKNYPSRQS